MEEHVFLRTALDPLVECQLVSEKAFNCLSTRNSVVIDLDHDKWVRYFKTRADGANLAGCSPSK